MAGGRLTKEALLKIVTDDGDAVEKLDKIGLKADELRAQFPEYKIKIDAAEASAKLKIFRAQLDLATRDKTVNIEVKEGGTFKRLLEGGLGKLLGGGSGAGGGGAGGAGEAAGGNPGLLVASIPLIAAALPLLAGIVNGLIAATAGVGAFGLLAIPTFDKIKNAYTAISAAQLKYNNALALEKEFPTTAHAKAATTALQQLQVAQENMGPSTRQAVTGLENLVNTFHKMATAFAPTVLKVFNDGLKVANDLLPALGPLAQAAGGAIGGLLDRLDKFVRSSGFQEWLKQFTALAGPAITAIGTGLGKVIIQFGKLLTIMSSKDVVHSLNIAFDILAGTIAFLSFIIARMMNHWDRYLGQWDAGWRNIKQWTLDGARAVGDAVEKIGRFFTVSIPRFISEGVAWFRSLPGRILSAIGNLGGLLVSAGRSIIDGLINGIKSAIPGLSSVLGWVSSLIPNLKGPPAKDRQLLFGSGQLIMGGLSAGITSQLPGLSATLNRATDTIAGHGFGSGRAGGRGGVLQVEWVGGGSDQEVITWLKKHIRIRGGDPTVLGR